MNIPTNNVITREWLIRNYDCPDGLTAFDKLFPQGVMHLDSEIDIELVRRECPDDASAWFEWLGEKMEIYPAVEGCGCEQCAATRKLFQDNPWLRHYC